MATKTSSFTSPLSGDFTQLMGKSMSDAVAEMQAKAQTAYDKGTTMVAEMTDLAKGNAEALVESGKILAAGLQDLGKSYAEDAKSSYETITADFKEMAAIKSPTELFQLQGKIMRRNFDAMVAATSKGTEHGMKLANEAFAPLTARVNLAVEKLSKAA
ncbi:MAG: phasin family protein [Pseudomonadota bacterium]